MTTALNPYLARLSVDAREAFMRCLNTRRGTVRKTAPNRRQDPLAWAAWQGFRTGCGLHGESATFGLMMLGDDARRIWDEVSDVTIAARRDLRANKES